MFPARPVDLLGWLAGLAAEGNAPATVRTYFAAVAHWHRGMGGPNPADDPEVRRFVGELERQAAADGRTRKQLAPLRWHHIRLIADAARKPRPAQPGGRQETAEQAALRGEVDIAMVAVAHDASLRASELLALTWADIDLPRDGGLGHIRVPPSDTAPQDTAPISEFAAQALARIRPPDADPAQRVFDFSATTATRRIKAATQAAGIDPTAITANSPRLGMAQDLAAYSTHMLEHAQTHR